MERRMKLKILYHGSPKKIKGKHLIPKKAHDLGNHPDNIHKAIYATDIRKFAITMAIITSKGVYGSSLKFKKNSKGIIYSGWPKQRYVYIYILPNKTFIKSKQIKHQYFSKKPVKPIRTIKILVKDNLNLVQKASKKEALKYCKKYNLHLDKIK